MTTFEDATARALSWSSKRLAARAARRAQRVSRTASKAAPSVARSLLTLAALGSFTYAASTFALWTGLVVGGLACLYLANAIGDD